MACPNVRCMQRACYSLLGRLVADYATSGYMVAGCMEYDLLTVGDMVSDWVDAGCKIAYCTSAVTDILVAIAGGVSERPYPCPGCHRLAH